MNNITRDRINYGAMESVSNIAPRHTTQIDAGAISDPKSIEEAEVLHASLKAGSAAQIVVAIVALVAFLYFFKFVLVTTLLALLLAFVLESLVRQLVHFALPRPVAASIAVVVAVILAGSLVYFLYGRAEAFASELQKYSERIERSLKRIEQPITKLETSAHSVTSAPTDGRSPIPVKVQEPAVVSRLLTANSGVIERVLLAAGFLPFLTYFMLTYKDHAHHATLKLFPEPYRLIAYRTIATISAMIRSFLVGNLFVGLIGASLCTALFWFVGVPYFYFIGAISGFLNLIPSVGALLALLPALVGAIGSVHRAGFVMIVVGIISIHTIMMNVLYPKLVGGRVRLNPLAVVLSLLFWSWIWGGLGLILAVPITGTAKIICDRTDSLRGLGAWLGD